MGLPFYPSPLLGILFVYISNLPAEAVTLVDATVQKRTLLQATSTWSFSHTSGHCFMHTAVNIRSCFCGNMVYVRTKQSHKVVPYISIFVELSDTWTVRRHQVSESPFDIVHKNAPSIFNNPRIFSRIVQRLCPWKKTCLAGVSRDSHIRFDADNHMRNNFLNRNVREFSFQLYNWERDRCLSVCETNYSQWKNFCQHYGQHNFAIFWSRISSKLRNYKITCHITLFQTMIKWLSWTTR